MSSLYFFENQLSWCDPMHFNWYWNSSHRLYFKLDTYKIHCLNKLMSHILVLSEHILTWIIPLLFPSQIWHKWSKESQLTCIALWTKGVLQLGRVWNHHSEMFTSKSWHMRTLLIFCSSTTKLKFICYAAYTPCTLGHIPKARKGTKPIILWNKQIHSSFVWAFLPSSKTSFYV